MIGKAAISTDFFKMNCGKTIEYLVPVADLRFVRRRYRQIGFRVQSMGQCGGRQSAIDRRAATNSIGSESADGDGWPLVGFIFRR